MGRRDDLQNVLEDLLGTDEVYFQPGANVEMLYPAIVYQRDGDDAKFADNELYSRTVRYQVTVITQDPNSDIGDKVARLPLCRMATFFVADNLNHDVFNLYY